MFFEEFSYLFRFPYPNDETVNFETVVSTISPYCVAYDSENSHLYWSGSTLSGKIMRCNSNGSELTVIGNAYNPMTLALDTHTRFDIVVILCYLMLLI